MSCRMLGSGFYASLSAQAWCSRAGGWSLSFAAAALITEFSLARQSSQGSASRPQTWPTIVEVIDVVGATSGEWSTVDHPRVCSYSSVGQGSLQVCAGMPPALVWPAPGAREFAAEVAARCVDR